METLNRPYPLSSIPPGSTSTTTTTNRSIIKNRRSFSSQEPSSFQVTPAHSQFSKTRLDTLAEIPSALTKPVNPTEKPKLFKRFVQQKIASGWAKNPQQQQLNDLKDIDTINSSEGNFSVGEIPVASLVKQQSSGDRRRSFSVIETFGPGGSKTTTTDLNMHEYIRQTSKWRSMRGQMNLPPDVRMKLENRKPLSFKNFALGVLHDVESRHSRF